MLFFFAIVLIGAHAAPWVYRSDKWLENPARLLSTLSGLVIIPYYLLIASGYRSPVLDLYPDEDLLVNLAFFALLYSLGLIFSFIGVELGCKIRIPMPQATLSLSRRTIFFAIAALIGVFAFLTLEKITYAGGLSFLIANLSRRSELLAGTGGLSLLIESSGFMVGFLLLYSYGRYRWPSAFFIFGVVGFILVGFAVFGGRKLPMYLLIFSAIAYHAYVIRIRFLSVKTLLIAGSVAFFFVWMLSFRGSAEFQQLKFVDVVFGAVANASYIDTYVFIIDYFDRHGYWYGAAFGDLLIRLGLTSLGDFRVPLDEGVYIRTLFQGWTVTPPERFEYMFPSSWPPETFGNGYLNFGILGVLVFFFIRGFVVGLAYSCLQRSKWSPTLFFIFLFVVFNFHLTNLRLVQLASVLAPVLFLHYFLAAWSGKKKKN